MTAQPLTRVPPGEVAGVWPHIRDRIEALRRRFSEPWLTEHVFHELMLGGTHLWTTPDLRGFIVLQVLVNPYSRDLHVWMACNRTSARVGEYLEQLKGIAAENGCRRITFSSDRAGWLKALEGVRVHQQFSLALGE